MDRIQTGGRNLWQTLALNRAQAVYITLLIQRERAHDDPETAAMLDQQIRDAAGQIDTDALMDYLTTLIAEADEYGTWEMFPGR